MMSARHVGAGPVTYAKYAGDCWKCYGAINIGDLIVMVDERWEHNECPDLLDAGTGQMTIEDGWVVTPANTCEKCFQARSVSGACGCD